jgi:TolB protein
MAVSAASAAPSSRTVSADQAATAAAVPWSKVGPGWALATYSANQAGEGVKHKAGPTTLYLVNPQGGRYKLVTWSAHSPRTSWFLLGWSGDRNRALFSSGFAGSTRREHINQLQLRTGKVTSFTLPANVTAISYTRPDGLNILAAKGALGNGDGRVTLQRYSLTGKLQKSLATVRGLDLLAGITGIPPAPYNSSGTELAAGAANGLELISNAGGVTRKLPVPGVKNGCAAVRWWSARTILASCAVTNQAGTRMWLVPASGARPSALTPARTGSGFDLGDFNAWQLSSGLYLDGFGACGSLVIGRQPAHGKEQQVNVPGAASSLVVDATSSKLMVERINGCMPGISLVWFNPKTRAMKVAIPVGKNQEGVTAVVPYFIAGKF